MRRIIRIIPSVQKTRRGNPEHYEFLLECGHRSYEFHGPYSFVRYCVLAVNPKAEIMKHCYQCAKGREPSPKCSKTNLPIGFMPLVYCIDNCNDEIRMKCLKEFLEWDKKDKPYLYKK